MNFINSKFLYSSNLNNLTFQKPKFGLKVISLRQDEQLLVEPGAMLAFQNLGMAIEKNQAGIFNGLKVYVVGGESLFVNRFTGLEGGGWLSLEEQYDGQIVEVSLDKANSTLIVCHGAFVAATANINLKPRYEGIVGWLKGKGFGSIEATLKDGEKGKVYICTDEGQVKAIRIEESHPTIIDNEHILAYTPRLSSTIKKVGNIKSFVFGGEGFVNEFRGNGLVLVGSGAVTGHATWLTKLINNIWKAVYEEAIPNGVIFLCGAAGMFIGNYCYDNFFNVRTDHDKFYTEPIDA